MTEINLRAATQHDDELILELLKDMHREAGMGTINLDKVVNVIRHCREMGCIIIAEVQGIPRAIMGIRADKFWWSDDFAIFDQFTYVAPEARKLGPYLNGCTREGCSGSGWHPSCYR